MFKTAIPALAALLIVATSARADDSLEFDLDSINDAEISIQEVDFDIDVDALEADTDGLLAGDGDELDEAIGACFQHFGYRSFGHCYGNFYSYCQPIYRSYYFQSYCQPIVRCCRPVYSHYWGCW